jgi:hypothetical protein
MSGVVVMSTHQVIFFPQSTILHKPESKITREKIINTHNWHVSVTLAQRSNSTQNEVGIVEGMLAGVHTDV